MSKHRLSSADLNEMEIPTGSDTRVGDPVGLFARANSRGVVNLVYRFRIGSTRARLHLGRLRDHGGRVTPSCISLTEARRLARRAAGLVAQGLDPRREDPQGGRFLVFFAESELVEALSQGGGEAEEVVVGILADWAELECLSIRV